MKKTVLICAALIPAPAAAYDLQRSASGAAIRWTSPTLAVAIDPVAPSRRLDAVAAEQALDRALATWSGLPESGVDLYRLVGDGAPARCLVRFRSTGWADDDAQVLGRTRLEVDPRSGEAWSALIEVNEEGRVLTERSLETILVHELGHVLGLGHSTDRRSVMFETDEIGRSADRRPGDDDRAGLAILYAAPAVGSVVLDLRTTVGVRDLTACTRPLRGRGSHAAFVVGACPLAASSRGDRRTPPPTSRRAGNR